MYKNTFKNLIALVNVESTMRHICFEEEKGRSRHQQAWRTAGLRGPAGTVLSCTCSSCQRGMHLDELCHLVGHSTPGHAPTEMHMRRGKGTFIQGWRDCKLVQALQKSAWRILKKLKINLPNDQSIPLPWHLPRGLNVLLHRYLLSHVHCCSVHNS